MAEILATIDEVNAFLPEAVGEGTAGNLDELQVAVARIIRGNLSTVFDPLTLAAWANPDNTPEYIREAAAKLMAAHLYRRLLSQNSIEIGDRHYAQRLYDEAMFMITQVVAGAVDLGIVSDTSPGILTDADFFPNDATNRAFSMDMEL